MKTDILLLNHGLASGGTDSFVINAAKALQKEGLSVAVSLAVHPDSEKQFREDAVLEAGIPVYKTSDLDGIANILRHCVRLYRLLRREKPHVVHSNMDLFNGVNLLVALLAGVPVRVSHAHTSKSQYETNTGKHFIVSVYRCFMRFLCRCTANRFCGCSELAMEYLYGKRWKKLRRSAVIFNGIDLEKFNGQNSGAVRREFAPDQKPFHLTTVGYMSETKNPFFTVDVLCALREIRDDFDFLWIGGGELQAQVKAYASEKEMNSVIRFAGVRKDVNDILPCMHIFLMPSLFEGLPISLLEAQASDLVCVVSDTVTTQVDCGKCIFLPLSDGPQKWARKISDILDGKCALAVDKERLGKFSAENTIRQLEEIYS